MVQVDLEWAQRWVIASSSPFISTAARQKFDAEFKNIASLAPDWFSAWGAGHLSDVMATLDSDDPWLHLTITDGKALHPDGSPFGSWVDCTDLCQPSGGDPTMDLGLAAVAEPLSEKAALLVAVAAQGWKKTLELTGTSLLGEDREEGELFDTFIDALRYAKYRRSMYFGTDDYFTSMSGIAWLNRASSITANNPWDESGAARYRNESKAAPGTYGQLT